MLPGPGHRLHALRCVILLALAPASFATIAPRLVADLEPGTTSVGVSPTARPTATGSFIVFAADDGVHGMEPWATDGSAGGARLLVDLVPGPDGSSPSTFRVLGDSVIFAATDGDHGREPWITDGTAAGTTMLVDAAPGATSSAPRSFTSFGAGLLFTANDRDHGEEPWITDGTPVGTRLIRDLVLGTAPSFATSFVDLGTGIAVFAALAGPGSTDAALYRTDGSTAGTWKVAGPSVGGRNPYVEEDASTCRAGCPARVANPSSPTARRRAPGGWPTCTRARSRRGPRISAR